MRRVVVIGAGLGGLATSIRLAAAGYEVQVYEKQSGPGGKAFSERIGSYRFDTGPSLFTMREVFAELFAIGGKRLEDYLALQPLATICHYFWPDGTRFQSCSGAVNLGRAIERATGEPAEQILRYLRYSARVWDVAADLFLRHSLHEGATYRSWSFWRSLPQLGAIDALRSMHNSHRSFFASPKVQQFFGRYATYNGSSPYQAPATLNLIPHVEYALGSHAVLEGIHAVPRALERLARELGVQFVYGQSVERILHEGRGVPGPVNGVLLSGGATIPAEIVVSNADVTPTYQHLLADTDAPIYRRYQQLEPSSSGVVFYWGVSRSFPQLGLHNIFFSADYQREFAEIFQNQRCPADPTIYVNITSKTTPADAPAGGENWFVLVNAPYDSGQDWSQAAESVRAAVLRRLSDELEVDLAPLIAEEGRLLPPDIQRKTDSFRGSLYGISSNTRRAAFLRHPNRSKRYPGLFFVGGSAHPGGGMPLVVLGGKIVADLVRRYYPPL